MSPRLDLTPEQEQQAQALAARIQTRSAAAVLEIARTLVATTDATLFGDTEFAIRDRALGLVADAYAEHLGEKKVATAVRPSTARTAARRRRSTTTADAAPNPSADRSRAAAPTTIAACAGKAVAPGMRPSD